MFAHPQHLEHCESERKEGVQRYKLEELIEQGGFVLSELEQTPGHKQGSWSGYTLSEDHVLMKIWICGT